MERDTDAKRTSQIKKLWNSSHFFNNCQYMGQLKKRIRHEEGIEDFDISAPVVLIGVGLPWGGAEAEYDPVTTVSLQNTS